MLARRARVAAQAGPAAAAAIARRVAQHLSVARDAVVAGYWPLEGELDPRPTMARLAERGHMLALPRMQGRLRPLSFHRWSDDELVEGAFRVMEPAESAPVVWPDVVLVPLVAFDRSGHRLGYGAGFYDRTLAGLRDTQETLLTIGLAFAVQEVADVPAEPFDQPLDAVVTENAVHWRSTRPLDHALAGDA